MKKEYIVLKGRYIDRYRKENIKLQDETGDIDFLSYEEAELKVENYLETQDRSGELKNTKAFNHGKLQIKERTTKTYSYNVLKQVVGLEGFSFNLFVIVWNKETNECVWKFIEEDKLKSLINLMPDTWFMEDIVENTERTVNRANKEGIKAIRSMINKHSFGYPLTYNYIFDLCSTIRGFDEQTDINIVLESIYDRYIGRHFKETSE
jgi:hypothetical protein